LGMYWRLGPLKLGCQAIALQVCYLNYFSQEFAWLYGRESPYL